jgi:hypothetical protein
MTTKYMPDISPAFVFVHGAWHSVAFRFYQNDHNPKPQRQLHTDNPIQRHNSDARCASLLSIHMTELAQLAFALMVCGIIDTMFCALRK